MIFTSNLFFIILVYRYIKGQITTKNLKCSTIQDIPVSLTMESWMLNLQCCLIYPMFPRKKADELQFYIRSCCRNVIARQIFIEFQNRIIPNHFTNKTYFKECLNQSNLNLRPLALSIRSKIESSGLSFK